MGYVDENLDVEIKDETIAMLPAKLARNAGIILEMGINLSDNYENGIYDLKIERIKKYCFLLEKLNELSPLVDDVYSYVKEKK